MSSRLPISRRPRTVSAHLPQRLARITAHLMAWLGLTLALTAYAIPTLPSRVKAVQDKHRLIVVPAQRLRDGQFQTGDGTLRIIEAPAPRGDNFMLLMRGQF